MGDAEGQNTVVFDVRRILSTMRKQYDEIHISCKRTEEEFQRVREQIRQLDNFYRNRMEEKQIADKVCFFKLIVSYILEKWRFE